MRTVAGPRTVAGCDSGGTCTPNQRAERLAGLFSATLKLVQIQNSFSVGAPPERVYEFLLDVNQVVACVPGAELAEVVDPSTFKGRVKVKVGPITVAYAGTARIASRDQAARTATLEAEGRETTGPGSARATALMQVSEEGPGSQVTISADYTVAGRVAQFGRGVMEDVSRRLIGQMADCIKARLEAPAEASSEGHNPRPAPAPAAARPVNALSLLFSVFWDRIRRLVGGRPRP